MLFFPAADLKRSGAHLSHLSTCALVRHVILRSRSVAHAAAKRNWWLGYPRRRATRRAMQGQGAALHQHLALPAAGA